VKGRGGIGKMNHGFAQMNADFKERGKELLPLIKKVEVKIKWGISSYRFEPNS